MTFSEFNDIMKPRGLVSTDNTYQLPSGKCKEYDVYAAVLETRAVVDRSDSRGSQRRLICLIQ